MELKGRYARPRRKYRLKSAALRSWYLLVSGMPIEIEKSLNRTTVLAISQRFDPPSLSAIQSNPCRRQGGHTLLIASIIRTSILNPAIKSASNRYGRGSRSPPRFTPISPQCLQLIFQRWPRSISLPCTYPFPMSC